MCQPLDVGVNQSFKARVRRLWEEWLTSLLDQVDAVRDAMREEVSEWTAAVYWEMVGSPVLSNFWRRTGCNWFPGLVYEEDDVVADTTGDEDNGGNGDMAGTRAKTTMTAMRTMTCYLTAMRRGRRVTIARTDWCAGHIILYII
jgi:hypothetical protein